MISVNWGGSMIGRFIGSAVLRVVSPELVLALVAAGTIALLAVSALSSGEVAA